MNVVLIVFLLFAVVLAVPVDREGIFRGDVKKIKQIETPPPNMTVCGEADKKSSGCFCCYRPFLETDGPNTGCYFDTVQTCNVTEWQIIRRVTHKQVYPGVVDDLGEEDLS